MRSKAYILALSLLCCCFMPSTLFGVDILVCGEGTKPIIPKSLKPQYPPVVTSVEPSLLHLMFTANLGIVEVSLQNLDGIEVVKLSTNTAYRSELWINLDAGSYTLTVTDASDGIITQKVVSIP